MKNNHPNKINQFSTFRVAGRIYGIDVTRVQEIVKSMPITSIPLAPSYVTGLINLRGQVATAIGLYKLFNLTTEKSREVMNVVCRIDGLLISLQVDEIGDVVEVSNEKIGPVPQTVDENVRKFILGICKMPDYLLSIIDIDFLINFLSHKNIRIDYE